MFITADILQKRGACQEGLDFFTKHYPDGVEMIDVIKYAHLPNHFLHWGYQYLDPNPEEVAVYWSKVGVTNSQGVHQSSHIDGSIIVRESEYVEHSEYVYNSTNIANSTHIFDSKVVEDSHHILDSSFVENSCFVLKGANVQNSNEVYHSSYIINSDGVAESSNILECSAIWRSENLTNCGFCYNCRNVSNALFCTAQKDNNYMLFNKPVDEIRFNIIKKQFDKYKPTISLMESWDDMPNIVPRYKYDYRKQVENIPVQFWDWVRTLPGYDPMIIYALTYNDQFLNETIKM